MLKLLIFCFLIITCWPLALAALILFPLVWLLLLPFRIIGIAVEGVFQIIRALFYVPVRLLRGV